MTQVSHLETAQRIDADVGQVDLGDVTLQRHPGPVEQFAVRGIDSQIANPLVSDAGAAMLGDYVPDEGHVVGEPGEIGEEDRQLPDREAAVVDRPGRYQEHDGNGDRRHVAVDPAQHLGEDGVGEGGATSHHVEIAETAEGRTFGGRQLDRLHAGEGLTDEPGDRIGRLPHRPAPLADLRAERLGHDRRQGERYQQQGGESGVDGRHHRHRAHTEDDQATDVDPVLHVLEEVVDVVPEGAHGFSRRQGDHSRARGLHDPAQEVASQLQRLLQPVIDPRQLTEPDDQVAADGEDRKDDGGRPGGLGHRAAFGQSIEDLADQDAEEQRRAVDEGPHEHAVEEAQWSVADHLPHQANGAHGLVSPRRRPLPAASSAA